MNQEQNDFLELMRSLREQHDAAMTRRSQEFATLCAPVLAEAGVRKLVIGYSGSGDSGGVDHLEALGDGGQKLIELSGPPEGIESLLDAGKEGAAAAFDAFVNSIIPQGFEINEGGQGWLTLDVVNGKWSLDHSQNVCSTEESHEEGQF